MMLLKYENWKRLVESSQAESATYLTFDYSSIYLTDEVKLAMSKFFSQFRDLNASDPKWINAYTASITIESTVEEFDLLSSIGASLKTTYSFDYRNLLLNESILRANNSDLIKLVSFDRKSEKITFAFFGDLVKESTEELTGRAFSEKKIREASYEFFQKTVSPVLTDADLRGTIKDLTLLNQELEKAVIDEEKIDPKSHLASSTGFNFSLYFLLVHLPSILLVSREDVDTVSLKAAHDQTFERLKKDADTFNRLSDQQKKEFVSLLVSFQADLSRSIRQDFRIDKALASRQLMRTFAMLSDSGITELDLEKYYEPSWKREPSAS
jgi:hypothetical protein